MITRSFFNKLIVLGFISIVGFCLARAIYYQSVMGIILAIVSLGAAAYFMYILAKAKEEMGREEAV